jgi:hypothetical protein
VVKHLAKKNIEPLLISKRCWDLVDRWRRQFAEIGYFQLILVECKSGQVDLKIDGEGGVDLKIDSESGQVDLKIEKVEADLKIDSESAVDLKIENAKADLKIDGNDEKIDSNVDDAKLVKVDVELSNDVVMCSAIDDMAEKSGNVNVKADGNIDDAKIVKVDGELSNDVVMCSAIDDMAEKSGNVNVKADGNIDDAKIVKVDGELSNDVVMCSANSGKLVVKADLKIDGNDEKIDGNVDDAKLVKVDVELSNDVVMCSANSGKLVVHNMAEKSDNVNVKADENVEAVILLENDTQAITSIFQLENNSKVNIQIAEVNVQVCQQPITKTLELNQKVINGTNDTKTFSNAIDIEIVNKSVLDSQIDNGSQMTLAESCFDGKKELGA